MKIYDSVMCFVKVVLFSSLSFSIMAEDALTRQIPCPRCKKDDCEYMVGVNLAGAEFAASVLPGIEGKNFGWPTAENLDYWKKNGVRLIRLPILWERLQPELKKDFENIYCNKLKDTVKMIGDREMLVIIDVHNYAKYRGKAIGSEECPVDAFADLWGRLAKMFNAKKGVWGYGLMNEPGKCDWVKAAQAAIDAIRQYDRKTRIFIANDYAAWSATYAKGDLVEFIEKTLRIPDPTVLKDPSNMLRFELHTYFDHDNSGTYRKTYEEEVNRKDGPGHRVCPEIGIQRIKPFVEWLKKYNVKGFVGEYSAPANPDVDGRWLEILDRTLSYMQENCLPNTYWGAGIYWTPGNSYLIEPRGWKDSADRIAQKDRPQLIILKKYLK